MTTPAIINGINHLKKTFNKKIKFIDYSTYINIYTDIHTISDLELFIAELKKTHVYTNPKFDYVSIQVNILHTHSGNGYHIMLVGSETLNSDNSITRKENFFAVVHKSI